MILEYAAICYHPVCTHIIAIVLIGTFPFEIEIIAQISVLLALPFQAFKYRRGYSWKLFI